jgi:hypothetical protein
VFTGNEPEMMLSMNQIITGTQYENTSMEPGMQNV